MLKPLRALVDVKKYKRTKQLNWKEESIEAFHYCRAAVAILPGGHRDSDPTDRSLQTSPSDSIL